MNNQSLPPYPEHPEPTESTPNAEYDRETKPRMSPSTLVWIGLAIFVIIFAAQKYLTPYLNKPVSVPAPATVPGK